MKNITSLMALLCFTLVSYGQNYCVSNPTSNDGQGISNITLEASSFESAGDVTYEDFTSTNVDVSQSTNANLLITFATGYTYNTNVWIDLNDDFVYDNDTELMFQDVSTAANPTTLDASFFIPTDSGLGVHNMRIGTADSGQATPNPCYNGTYGVTIDMLINITGPPSCLAPADLTIVSALATGAEVSWTADAGITEWEYIIQPQGTGAPTTNGISINTSFAISFVCS